MMVDFILSARFGAGLFAGMALLVVLGLAATWLVDPEDPFL